MEGGERAPHRALASLPTIVDGGVHDIEAARHRVLDGGLVGAIGNLVLRAKIGAEADGGNGEPLP